MELSKCFTFTLIFILAVIAVNKLVSGQKQLPCNKNTHDEVDRILSRINPLGNPDVEFPETVAESRKNCNQLRKPMALLEDLNRRCMKGLFKEVVSIVIFSVKKKRRNICGKRPTAELRDLLEAGKCVNKGRKQIENCANRGIDNFLGIKNVEQNVKIPLVCCEISKVKGCMVNVMSKESTCTEKHKETLLSHFEGLSGNALKLACNDYEENGEKCNKLKGINLRLNKGQKRPKSLLTPVIELFESLDK